MYTYGCPTNVNAPMASTLIPEMANHACKVDPTIASGKPEANPCAIMISMRRLQIVAMKCANLSRDDGGGGDDGDVIDDVDTDCSDWFGTMLAPQLCCMITWRITLITLSVSQFLL